MPHMQTRLGISCVNTELTPKCSVASSSSSYRACFIYLNCEL